MAASPPLHDLKAPGLGLLALEFRALWEFGALAPAWPILARAPRGDSHTVIVFPGLSANDGSTVPLRRFLSHLGYDVRGWTQGFNLGPRAGVLEKAREQITEAARVSSRAVTLVGWSLGGVYARELAKELPDAVRGVVTLGSPFGGPPRSTNAWRIYEAVSGRNIERETAQFDLAVAPPVPTTSIYSRSDGIVAWQGSVQRDGHARCENIEVVASHIGLGVNPSAWWAVADRLAQPEGTWTPFVPGKARSLKGLIFPDPARG